MNSTINSRIKDDDIMRIFARVSTSLIFISQAYAYCESYFSIEANIANQIKGSPFEFSRITYQYFMVIQFCKLFEKSKNKQQADSSLIKLNELVYEKNKQLYNLYNDNSSTITQIKTSDTFKLFKILRDKIYTHSDNHELNLLLKFRFLTELQLSEFKKQMIKTISIFNTINNFYGEDVTFHNWYDSNTPRNFLKNYFKFKESFIKNIRK
jgi:hypothetical protein